MIGLRRAMYKTPAQLRQMVAPGRATLASLDAVRDAIRPGVTTFDLDRRAEAAIIACGGRSNFQLEPGYRHTICTSVNDEVVHGIPGDRALAGGDIVSVDSGAIVGGWNGDAAITVVIPDPSRPDVVHERETLSAVTRGSLWAAIARLATAKHLNEVGEAIEDHVNSHGTYGILTDYVGHGIGRSMHEAPPVFNYRTKALGPEVKPGLVVAIEPMVVLGDPKTFVANDGWTVVTADGRAASHWEHSVAVHRGGIWVLTAPDGGAADLAPYGITPAPID